MSFTRRTLRANEHIGLTAWCAIAIILAYTVLSGGCMAVGELDDFDDASAPESEPQIIEYTPDILAELDLAGDVKVTFASSYDSPDVTGDPVVSITTSGPDSAFPYLDYLVEREATSLEAFLALAPKGSDVPAVLREAHMREAAHAGRSPEVREIALDDVKLATYPSSSCDNFAAFNDSLSSWAGETTDASTQFHSLTQHVGSNILAAMCNYKSNRVDYKYAQFCWELEIVGSPLGILMCEPKILVPDGHRVNKSWYGATSSRVVRAEKLENYTLTVTSYIGIGMWQVIIVPLGQ